jgi:diaminohydroxyphosphoribosylaminopyrimidine deaminase/5-amino-6-(5-phosphoribosylamino)uracil reductase
VHGEGIDRDYPGHVESQSVSPADGGLGLDLAKVLSVLAERDIGELLVESGATLAGALLRQGLVDELLIYVAPLLLGASGRPLLAGIDPTRMSERQGLTLLESRHIGPDLRLRFRPENQPAD